MKMTVGFLLMKRNDLVQKHNSLDIAFFEERRALQSEISDLEQDIIDCYPKSQFGEYFRNKMGASEK